ncbi:ABC transporter ATP-binding protein [Dietzia sp. PP-33]|uniref:ABC transporter ATP-binding protein n=1 Tax=Dietzia sp. PP-33 TaxID=2957500 RepID=UPI0029B09672|nr:ABC transporter ATP-binding protein [Dietzia sp. PP-33]MDX2356730.1 ABC transporter ATP-binding protein [Dietzia sp. PP-33]
MTENPDGTDEAVTGEAAVRTTDVTRRHGSGENQVLALDRVSISVEAGRFTMIMGPSGSGKSTLMHVLAGLDSPDEGRVFIGRREITEMSDKALTELRRTRTGFVFQSFNLIPTLSVEQNIGLPAQLAGEKVDADWGRTVTERLGIAALLDRKPHELSGGQQQRVAVARALVNRPAVVFADEPTGNLDSVSGAEVMRLLAAAVREYGQTVVMVTHDPGLSVYADRVIILADGRPAADLTDPGPEAVADTLLHLNQDPRDEPLPFREQGAFAR